ncbi:MAG: glycosyltransferase family 4 protein [Planctomycetota bacterium]|nr:glycosyltransferase family 4 protein [Planctomycetota bacterium]
MSTGRGVYASFDRVPAPKGAAVHIQAFAQALAQSFGPLDLVTLAAPPAGEAPPAGVGPARELWPGVTQHPIHVHGSDAIARALSFRAFLGDWWGARRARFAHVRSIFEGYPLARRKGQACEKLIYEVNGLPSIELKYHHPGVADDTELTRKLLAQEQACLDAADLLVTPSAVTAAHLRAARGVDAKKLRVIPNGVDLEVFPHRPPPPRTGELRVLYSGTLAAWQGARVAVEALALLRRDVPARLTLVGHAGTRQRKNVLERVHELKLAAFVELREPVAQADLAALHHEHDAALAPLMPNDRNLVQGCCPLKVLEAMAAGAPLVASEMPVVTDLARPGEHFLAAKPGNTKQIKDALLRLHADAALAARLSSAARAHVAANFTWRRAQESLVEAYREALGLGPG